MTKKANRDIRTIVTGLSASDSDYVELANADWLFIEQKLRTKLPRKLKIQLSGITMLYSLASFITPQMTSLTKAKSDILLWSKRTSNLRKSLWKKPRPKTVSTPQTLKKIITDNFHLRRGMHTAIFPMAHLAQFLDGAEAIGKFFIDLLDKEKKNSDRTELWLIWTALIIALCRKSNVPVEENSNTAMSPGFIILLEKLQSTLIAPTTIAAVSARVVKTSKKNKKFRKPSIKTGDSLQRSARQAFQIAEGNPVDELAALLIFRSTGWWQFGAGKIEIERKVATILCRVKEQVELRKYPAGTA